METSTFFRMCDTFAPLTVEVSSRPPVITLLFPLHTSFFPSFGGGSTPQGSRLPITAATSAPVVLSNMAMPRRGVPLILGGANGRQGGLVLVRVGLEPLVVDGKVCASSNCQVSYLLWWLWLTAGWPQHTLHKACCWTVH